MVTEAIDGARHGQARMLPNQLLGLRDLTSKVLIYRGGYRAGKTVFLVAKARQLGRMHHPFPVLAVAPTYSMVVGVFKETCERMCDAWKLKFHWAPSKKTITVGSGAYRAEIWVRGCDSPRSLEGLTVGSLVGDEWELWPPQALTVAMARVSVGPCQQIVLGGTPEGFGRGYQLLEKNPAPTTRVIVSKTTDNRFVRASYTEDMRSRLSEAEASEKLDGERTAPDGRVYTRFDRAIHCAAPCVDLRDPELRLEVWAGFNPSCMCWAFVLVDEGAKAFHVVGELVARHTDSQKQCKDAVAWIQSWQRKHHRTVDARGIKVVCDSRGTERKAKTPISHVMILKEAGFSPLFGLDKPSDDDVVASVQKVLAEVRLTFDEKAADYVTRCVWMIPKGRDGMPSRDPTLDLDAGAGVIGTGIMWRSPATRPRSKFLEEQQKQRWQRVQKGINRHGEIRDVLAARLRDRVLKAAKGGIRAGDAAEDLGCSIDDFMMHIEGKFIDGMSWDNYGVHGWHFDHIRPLSSFNLEDRAQFLDAVHFSNYQPMWARDNVDKGSKWSPDDIAPERKR